MPLNTQTITELRHRTGAGIVECQKVLEEAGGDVSKAIEILRKRGLKKVTARAQKLTHQGLIHSYVHSGGKAGALIEVGCETDFVARNLEFQDLVHDLAMQVVSMDPLYIKPEDVPTEVLEKEKEMYREELEKEEKPREIIEKILTGKMIKFFEEVCLVKQPFIKDEKKIIEDLINEKMAKLGEKIEVKRFVRYEL